jgi:hypothetical protein
MASPKPGLLTVDLVPLKVSHFQGVCVILPDRLESISVGWSKTGEYN